MKIRHGTWYQTRSGHAVFVKKTKAEGKEPIHGVIVTSTGTPKDITWCEGGVWKWSAPGFYSGLDIVRRWPHAKPKWCEVEQRYLLPKGVEYGNSK